MRGRARAEVATSSPTCGRRAWWRTRRDRRRETRGDCDRPASPARVRRISRAPLYVAWQITNECNLACLHCIEESGPGKAFRGRALRAQTSSRVLDQMIELEVPYLSFSGGEPMVHPHFFEMVERVCSGGGQLKIETNGHYLTPENCARLATLGVKAVQVSLDGASRATFNRMRVRGEFDRAVDGMRNLRDAGVPIEINFSPTRFNVARDRRGRRPRLRARRVQLLHGPHDVHRQRRQGLAPSRRRPRSSTRRSSTRCAAKAEEYRGRMRVYFHEMGLLEELRYRLQHPAALLIVLPNGLVKLINALPFICGDLRTRAARGRLGQLPARVARSARRAVRRRPRAVIRARRATLHQWVHL